MEVIDFGVNFVVGNSNKLQKIRFGKKNHLGAQCVHIAEFRNFQFQKSAKIKMCSHMNQWHRLH
jgi:hypothetical protein